MLFYETFFVGLFVCFVLFLGLGLEKDDGYGCFDGLCSPTVFATGSSVSLGTSVAFRLIFIGYCTFIVGRLVWCR